ncbi:MAG: P1 family peptidase [Alphaproteobacteria bacterium]
MIPGPKNLLTDVPGLLVGNASDDDAKSGVTVVLCEEPCVASAHVMGGGPGTRETDLLRPEQTIEAIDAIVLSGGSAFGLDAATGVADRLAAAGRGFAVGPARVPLVPAAILFDLLNGGDKGTVDKGLYRTLAAQAFDHASDSFTLGSVGAGTGGTLANVKGGLGSASVKLPNGRVVAALAAVSPVGQVTIGDTQHFWAAPFELNGEFGGLGYPHAIPPEAQHVRHKLQARAGQNTALVIVATDAPLSKAQANRLAITAHTGIARAIWPSHTPYDGDIVFALSTDREERADEIDMIELGAVASACVTRACARGVYEAAPAPDDPMPTWRERFGG